MALLLSLSVAAAIMTSNPILEQEFGIHGDQMPSVPAAQRLAVFKFQTKHSKAYEHSIISPSNSPAERTIGSNSQFRQKPLARGSTLRAGYQSMSINAPSRFSGRRVMRSLNK